MPAGFGTKQTATLYLNEEVETNIRQASTFPALADAVVAALDSLVGDLLQVNEHVIEVSEQLNRIRKPGELPDA